MKRLRRLLVVVIGVELFAAVVLIGLRILLQDAAAAQASVGNPATTKTLVERQFDEQGFPTAIAWELLGDIEIAGGQTKSAAWRQHMRQQCDISKAGRQVGGDTGRRRQLLTRWLS